MDPLEQVFNGNAATQGAPENEDFLSKLSSYAINQFPETTRAAAQGPGEFARSIRGDTVDLAAEAAKAIYNTKGDVAGSTGSALLGARAGAGFGVPGIILGGAIGAIPGSTLGKYVDQSVFGTQPKQGLIQNLGRSAIESAAGLGLEALSNIVPGAKREAGNLLMKLARRKGAQEVPYDKAAADVVLGAEKRLTGENKLPNYMYDPNLQYGAENDIQKLQAVIEREGYKNPVEQSPLFKNTSDVQNQTLEKISSKAAPLAQNETLQNEIKDSVSTGFKTGQQNYKKMQDELYQKAKDYTVPFEKEKLRGEILDAIDSSAAFGNAEKAALRKEVSTKFDALTPGINTNPVTMKKSISGDKLLGLREDLKSMMDNFKVGKESQGKESGLISKEILPVVDRYNEGVLGKDISDLNKSIQAQKQEFAIGNSPLAKKLGLTERVQDIKNMQPEAIEKAVFDNTDTYNNFLALTKNNPALRDKVTEAYKARIYSDVKNNGYQAIEKELKNKDPEFLKNVFGQQGYQNLVDAKTVLQRFGQDDFSKKALQKTQSGGVDFDPTSFFGSGYLQAKGVQKGISGLKNKIATFGIDESSLVNNMSGVKGLQNFANSDITELANKLRDISTTAATQAVIKPVMAKSPPSTESSRDPLENIFNGQ